MKRFQYFVIVVSTLLFASCNLLPHQVTDRYLIKITDNQFEVEIIEYDSDSIAIATERDNFVQDRKLLLDMIDNYLATNPDLTDFKEKTKMDAYESLLRENRCLVFVKHQSTMDAEELKAIIKEYGFDRDKLEKYGKENEIEIYFHNL